MGLTVKTTSLLVPRVVLLAEPRKHMFTMAHYPDMIACALWVELNIVCFLIPCTQ